ncbi:MAG: peptidyl-prolyl cis-trans isomerase, partial [Halioglobus sp.]|nr:peptidyl-prolyl cis-trans isomerase [Halioglobus sp.]
GSMEQFQVDGRFSAEMYKSVLANAGFTPAYFKQSLRDDMVQNQLRSGLAGSEFATPAELQVDARITQEQRDIRYLTVPVEDVLPGDAQVSQEQIEAYYAANEAQFMTPESVDLEYIELSAQDFYRPVAEDDVVEAYQLARQNYQYQTEYRVSHILFEPGADGERDTVAQRVKEARARLAAGEEFARVARELSDDIGSAGNGGDLGYTRGDTFPPEMERAIAELEPNTVSQPVETDAGTHLIVVTERREGSAPTLEEIRPELEQSLQAETARTELLRTVEALRDLAFNADGLAVPAAELDLDVQRAGGITRSQAQGLFSTPALLAAAFSDEVLQAGHNSEVIELGGEQFVVLHVVRHNEPRLQELAAVRDAIVDVIAENTARAAVLAQAQRALEQLRAGSGIEEVATAAGYEWQVELGARRDSTMVPPDVLRAAFELPAPAAGEALSSVVVTPGGDAQVFEVIRVTPGDYARMPDAQQQVLQQEISAQYSTLVDREFQRGLRQAADIEVM